MNDHLMKNLTPEDIEAIESERCYIMPLQKSAMLAYGATSSTWHGRLQLAWGVFTGKQKVYCDPVSPLLQLRQMIIESCGTVDITNINGHATTEGQANARLIAAAPDLLAALRGLMACIEAEWGADLLPFNLSSDDDATANAAILAARAALAPFAEVKS